MKVIQKRNDGYHDIETVFYPVPVKEALEIIAESNAETLFNHKKNRGVQFSNTGLTVSGKPDNNLCMTAYHLLQKDYPSIPSIQMHLHKTIPIGAGLGGGSSDGAFVLKLLNEMFNLRLTTGQLIGYALQLGSDCPFFILDKPCYATGRGELLEEISLDLSTYTFVLVNPGIHVNTGWAFSELNINGRRVSGRAPSLKETVQLPVNIWHSTLINDFEEPVSHHYPEITAIKNELYQKGAIYAAMTGSGSTVFGLFHKEHRFSNGFPSGYTVMIS